MEREAGRGRESERVSRAKVGLSSSTKPFRAQLAIHPPTQTKPWLGASPEVPPTFEAETLDGGKLGAPEKVGRTAWIRRNCPALGFIRDFYYSVVQWHPFSPLFFGGGGGRPTKKGLPQKGFPLFPGSLSN